MILLTACRLLRLFRGSYSVFIWAYLALTIGAICCICTGQFNVATGAVLGLAPIPRSETKTIRHNVCIHLKSAKWEGDILLRLGTLLHMQPVTTSGSAHQPGYLYDASNQSLTKHYSNGHCVQANDLGIEVIRSRNFYSKHLIAKLVSQNNAKGASGLGRKDDEFAVIDDCVYRIIDGPISVPHIHENGNVNTDPQNNILSDNEFYLKYHIHLYKHTIGDASKSVICSRKWWSAFYDPIDYNGSAIRNSFGILDVIIVPPRKRSRASMAPVVYGSLSYGGCTANLGWLTPNMIKPEGPITINSYDRRLSSPVRQLKDVIETIDFSFDWSLSD